MNLGNFIHRQKSEPQSHQAPNRGLRFPEGASGRHMAQAPHLKAQPGYAQEQESRVERRDGFLLKTSQGISSAEPGENTATDYERGSKQGAENNFLHSLRAEHVEQTRWKGATPNRGSADASKIDWR
jgi:hypothetical protein